MTLKIMIGDPQGHYICASYYLFIWIWKFIGIFQTNHILHEAYALNIKDLRTLNNYYK